MTFERAASLNQNLLVVDRLVYLNLSIGISKVHCPDPLVRDSFLHRINSSGVKIRPVLKKNSWYLFHEVDNAASLYCRDNYNLWK